MSEPEQPGQERPAFLLLDLTEVDPARYSELEGQLADIPYRRAPKALVEAVGNLTLPSPEFDHEPDPVEKRALVDFARRTLSEHAATRSVGTLWNNLFQQWQWATRRIAKHPAEAEDNSTLLLLANLFITLPNDRGPQTLLDARTLYNLFLVAGPAGQIGDALRAGDIGTNRLINFINERYGVSLPRFE